MTGAELLIKTAVKAGIEICFTNPGTTEMPLVCAFDSVVGIRPILGLFEGCCTAAADGYGRMTDKPAMTLLHLGPGLGNGIANLHNARRARTPVLNIIGEHATWHRSANAPLSMDIAALAETVSDWQGTCDAPQNLSRDTADAITAALTGKVATLIVPSDVQWSDSPGNKIHLAKTPDAFFDEESIQEAADLLRTGQKTALILGGRTLRKRGLTAAARIKAKTGCDLLSERAPTRMERGVGIPATEFIPYFPRQALDLLSKYQAVILAGAGEPVTFFGWQGYGSRLLNDHQDICHLKATEKGLPQALENLADAIEAPAGAAVTTAGFSPEGRPGLPQGKLTAQNACLILASLQPEDAIIVNESITSGAAYFPLGPSLPPHTLLMLTGGAIGYGMPCAVGAAIACPQRPVINFQADGSAMYTLQALWMQAREGLNVTTLICSNRCYHILNIEFARAEITSPGPYAQSLTDLGNPNIDWVRISQGLGVPAVAVDSCEELAKELTLALDEPGPHLIEMVF
ncbi:MAG: acetolactate synthase large subunit [Desulfobacteraceae bacterium]|jgi:acetolactate synthase-1/2/3 large subunit|nr:acetolactate synthase large subunit [Desulfobacteraceae bacterium]